jgi:single-strand DNA-binding protein
MFQSIVVAGRLGKDPDFRKFDEEKQVCKFVVAVQDGFGHKQRTEWFNCTIWNKKAQIFFDRAQKGTLVFVEGKQSTSEWTDANGKKNYRAEIQVGNFRVISNGKVADEPAFDPNPQDDLPF